MLRAALMPRQVSRFFVPGSDPAEEILDHRQVGAELALGRDGGEGQRHVRPGEDRGRRPPGWTAPAGLDVGLAEQVSEADGVGHPLRRGDGQEEELGVRFSGAALQEHDRDAAMRGGKVIAGHLAIVAEHDRFFRMEGGEGMGGELHQEA